MHPFSVHTFYDKSRYSESNGIPAYLLLFYYLGELALTGIDYFLNALNREILFFGELLERNAVQQLTLEDHAIPLVKYPLINKVRPLRPGQSVCFDVEDTSISRRPPKSCREGQKSNTLSSPSFVSQLSYSLNLSSMLW